MGIGERIVRWFELPVVEQASAQCTHCETMLAPEETVCPECGGEREQVTVPVRYMYGETF